MLSSTELAGMREAANLTLPDPCYVLSGTATPDAMGGETVSWGTSATTVCRLDMKRGVMQLAGGGVQPFTEYIMTLPYDTTISEANRISHGGITYTVTSVNADISWPVVKRVVVEAL